MRDHKDLDVWKSSIDLVTEIYKLTVSFPREEMFCLTAQMRRAAISIPSNISEGAARNTDKEFLHFLFVARGSAAELETQLVIANNLGYVSNISTYMESLLVVMKLLSGLIRHYEKNGNRHE
jgi:four helix bundle protein